MIELKSETAVHPASAGFSAVADPSPELCAEVAALAPANPFYTYGYIQAKRTLGDRPLALVLFRGGRAVAGCSAFQRSGRLSRSLEIPSVPELSAGDGPVFWEGLLKFCRKGRISSLDVNTYASNPGAAIPHLPGEESRIRRWEFVMDLQAADFGLHKNHRYMIRKAQKAGLQLRYGLDRNACEEHARLITASMELRKKRGESVPTHAEAANGLAMTGHRAGELFQAVLEGQVVSSALVLVASLGMYVQSSGTSPEGRECGAAHFVWHEVARAAQSRSMSVWNLGGADDLNSGLAQFKAHFGTTPIQLEAAGFYLGSAVEKVFTSTCKRVGSRVFSLVSRACL